MRKNRIASLAKKAYLACPGRTLHEKIMFLPEHLYKVSDNAFLREMSVDAKRAADLIASIPVRYILSDEVAGAALAICETKGESLKKILPHIRLPHQRMMIEFREEGRGRMSAIAGMGTPHPGKVYPEHTALLIETDETGRRGTVEMCWINPDVGISLYPVRLRFDLDDPTTGGPIDWSDPVDIGGGFKKHMPSDDDGLTRSWMEYARLEQGLKFRGVEPKAITYQRLQGVYLNHPSELAKEFRFLLSTLGMFALKNGVEYEEQRTEQGVRNPGGSIGRRLAAQAGTAPTILRMTMSLSRDPERDRELKTLLRRGEGHSSPGLHWVCGHFKVRKTGVYWWSPHLRGDKERDLTGVPREVRVVNPPDLQPRF
jgi:hypothetical protein